MNKVLRGERPKRPQDAERLGLDDRMWDMMEGCWRQNPAERLPLGAVIKQLKELNGVIVHVPEVWPLVL